MAGELALCKDAVGSGGSLWCRAFVHGILKPAVFVFHVTSVVFCLIPLPPNVPSALVFWPGFAGILGVAT